MIIIVAPSLTLEPIECSGQRNASEKNHVVMLFLSYSEIPWLHCSDWLPVVEAVIMTLPFSVISCMINSKRASSQHCPALCKA